MFCNVVGIEKLPRKAIKSKNNIPIANPQPTKTSAVRVRENLLQAHDHKFRISGSVLHKERIPIVERKGFDVKLFKGSEENSENKEKVRA